MKRNQRRQRVISQPGFKHSHCHGPQFPRTNRSQTEDTENWLQLRNRRRKQDGQLVGKNQSAKGEKYG